MIYRNLQEAEKNLSSDQVTANPTVSDSCALKNSNTFKPIIIVTDTENKECVKDDSGRLELPPKATESDCLSTLNENEQVTHFGLNTPSSSCKVQVQEDQTGNPREKQEIWGNLKLLKYFSTKRKLQIIMRYITNHSISSY